LKYTSAEVNAAKLASLFDIDGKLLVPNANYDSAALGVTSSITPFFADMAFLGYRPASAGPLKVSCGYIFRNSMPLTKRWRVEENEADAIEVNMEYQAKVVASLAGYLINNTV
jgi:hypothetical protein